LEEYCCSGCSHPPLSTQFVQHQQVEQAQCLTSLDLFRDVSGHCEVRRATLKDYDDILSCRSSVVRGLSSVAQLAFVYSVDPTPGSLDQACSLESIRQNRVTGARRGNKEIGQPHTFWESAGIADFEQVVGHLHMNGS